MEASSRVGRTAADGRAQPVRRRRHAPSKASGPALQRTPDAPSCAQMKVLYARPSARSELEVTLCVDKDTGELVAIKRVQRGAQVREAAMQSTERCTRHTGRLISLARVECDGAQCGLVFGLDTGGAAFHRRHSNPPTHYPNQGRECHT